MGALCSGETEVAGPVARPGTSNAIANLKMQNEELRAEIERAVSSVNRQIQISDDSAREAAEAKVTAELARDELVARSIQSTQQLRDQNQKLASQLAFEQSQKNVALERVKEVEEKFAMIREEKENLEASVSVTRFLSRKQRVSRAWGALTDAPILIVSVSQTDLGSRDRPPLSPKDNRVNVPPQSMSPREYRKSQFGAGLESSIDTGYSTYDSVSPGAMNTPERKQHHKSEFGAGLESTDAGYSTYDSVSPGAMNTPERSTGIGWTP